MKKIILAFLLSAISASMVLAAQSSSFYFTSALLQSIYKFNEAHQVMSKSLDREDKAIALREMEKSISLMNEAKNIIRPWISESDDRIKRPASAIDQGLDVFIADAKTALSFVERANRGETVGEDEGIDYAVEGEKREDAAYLNMGSEIAKYDPQGLSNSERRKLLLRIFVLFDKDLKKYRFHPTEVTEVTIGISALESRLEGKKVEENPYFKMLIDGEPPFKK